MTHKVLGGLVLLVTIALAACVGSGSSTGGNGNTVTMAGTSFASGTSITVAAGQSVIFDDPSDTGGTHLLTTGTNGTFSAEAGAPQELSDPNGLSFMPGDSKTIVFPTAGTYHITCKIHPSMEAIITVTS